VETRTPPEEPEISEGVTGAAGVGTPVREAILGLEKGLDVGSELVGMADGMPLGVTLGLTNGLALGPELGEALGLPLGATVGLVLGSGVTGTGSGVGGNKTELDALSTGSTPSRVISSSPSPGPHMFSSCSAKTESGLITCPDGFKKMAV
jgi:hypothetical protein